MPVEMDRDGEGAPDAGTGHLIALGCGWGVGRLGGALEAACGVLGVPCSAAHDLAVALWTARERAASGEPTALVAGPALTLAESVHLARALGGGGRSGAAPVVAVRDRLGADSTELLLGAGCCDCLTSGTDVDALVRAVRLALEIERRRIAESMWDEERTAGGDGGGRLADIRRLAAVGRTHLAYVHDLRNLVHPIRGYGELLCDAGTRPPDAARIGSWVASLADQMEELLRRSLSAGHGGQVALWLVADREVVRLEPLLRAITGTGIELETRLGGGEARIRARPGALDQIVLNLAENSRESMPRGGRLAVTTSAPAGRWRIVVGDSGRGIPAERLRSILDPGESRHEARAARGFGLWIVRGLVTELGGTIGVESDRDSGTRVTVELPAVESAAIGPE